MRLALSQINPIVGDIAGNCQKITDQIALARSHAADCILFPELALCGYPPKDLLLKPGFIANVSQALDQLAPLTRDGPTVLLGCVRPNPAEIGRTVRNTLACLSEGRISAEYHKQLLPTYDVFDEDRYFEPGTQDLLLHIPSPTGPLRVGLTICEDLWNDQRTLLRRLYHKNPIEQLARAGAQLILNASASPYTLDKQALREKLLSSQAAAFHVPLAMVNQIGGNDELIFDGASRFFDGTGLLRARAKAFAEDLLIIDTAAPQSARIEPYPDSLDSVFDALVLGTHDYVSKCGFREIVLGLSGGIDSALVAAVAARALGPARVHAIAMPSRYSSDHSLADAKSLAENLGVDFRAIPIAPIHDVFESHLAPIFAPRPPDATEENLQARIRGAVLMALSNKFGWLLLTTGNKSELAVGYCTLYGDMCGGLAVISDVPKTMVYALARRFNAKAGRPLIPESSLTKLPSAELRPDQHDQQSLPPYDTLDEILQRYIEHEKSADDIIAAGFDPAVVKDVIRKVDQNEYKRKQAATGLKVTSRAFGVGRRIPIAAKFT